MPSGARGCRSLYTQRMKRRSVLQTMLGFLGTTKFAPAPAKTDGSELMGHPAPRLDLEHWLNSNRTDVDDFRGKVVLLRWWCVPVERPQEPEGPRVVAAERGRVELTPRRRVRP